MADGDADEHHRERVGRVGPEAERNAAAFRQPRNRTLYPGKTHTADTIAVAAADIAADPGIADTDLTTSSEESAVHAIRLVRKIAKVVIPAFRADGVIVKQFNRAPAGQTIFHLHFHVIPVYEKAALKAHHRERADDGELAKQALLLRQSLG